MLCEDLSECLTEDFEDREEDLRAQGDPKILKLVEKRREKAEKRLKKTRDQTDKEKGNRYLFLNSFTYVYDIGVCRHRTTRYHRATRLLMKENMSATN